ncbi:DMT family transporter [Roseibium aggregatum]|uniref:DMT family transporter n=1 Tax=Roseibium aggregatum TaxID=187304 RepID=UPI0025AB80B2|nr:DMT family transporter [Roseibium aggregatum]WJS05474.1 DMT family transporter [Roseibium aggregatum]
MNSQAIVFSNKTKAILAMGIWAILSPLNGMFVKLMPSEIGSVLIVEISLAFFLLPGLVFLVTEGREHIAVRQMRIICLRGGACLASIAATFMAVRKIDYATVYFFIMTGPLLASLGGSILFSERVQRKHFLASLATLAGAFLALTPEIKSSTSELVLMGLVVLTSSALALTSRYVGRSPNVIRNTVISLSVAGWVVLPFALFQLSTLDLSAWPVMAGLSTTNFLAILLGAYAYEKATISSNAPYELLKVVCAVMLGAVVFGASPTNQVLWGVLIILAATSTTASHDLNFFVKVKTGFTSPQNGP